MKKYIITGFTLVEMMVALLVAAIFLGAVVPSYYSLIQNNKIVAMTNKLAASLNFARMEAIRRGQRVSICAAADVTLSGCGTQAQWVQGWIVFVDNNSDNSIDANDELLKVHESLPRGTTVTANTNIISYNGTGFITSGAVNLNISAANCNRDNRRNLTLSTTGHLSVSRVPCP